MSGRRVARSPCTPRPSAQTEARSFDASEAMNRRRYPIRPIVDRASPDSAESVSGPPPEPTSESRHHHQVEPGLRTHVDRPGQTRRVVLQRGQQHPAFLDPPKFEACPRRRDPPDQQPPRDVHRLELVVARLGQAIQFEHEQQAEEVHSHAIGFTGLRDVGADPQEGTKHLAEPVPVHPHRVRRREIVRHVHPLDRAHEASLVDHLPVATPGRTSGIVGIPGFRQARPHRLVESRQRTTIKVIQQPIVAGDGRSLEAGDQRNHEARRFAAEEHDPEGRNPGRGDRDRHRHRIPPQRRRRPMNHPTVGHLLLDSEIELAPPGGGIVEDDFERADDVVDRDRLGGRRRPPGKDHHRKPSDQTDQHPE